MATKKTGKPTGKPTTQQIKKGRQTVEAARTEKVLRVKADKAFTGARGAWFTALQAHDGKSPDAFVEACAAKPPVLTKTGKAEDPKGWLRYFVRTGVAQVEG